MEPGAHTDPHTKVTFMIEDDDDDEEEDDDDNNSERYAHSYFERGHRAVRSSIVLFILP